MAEVLGELAEHAHALEVAREFANKPRGRFPLAFPPDDVEPDVGHLHPLRSVVVLLDMEAEAITSAESPIAQRSAIQAMFNISAALDGEPILTSQLNRIGILVTAVRRVERSLALGFPPGDLKSLQAILAAEARTEFYRPVFAATGRPWSGSAAGSRPANSPWSTGRAPGHRGIVLGDDRSASAAGLRYPDGCLGFGRDFLAGELRHLPGTLHPGPAGRGLAGTRTAGGLAAS